MGCARRACRVSLNPSIRRSPTAWAWASRSAARSSKPMVGGCGRPCAGRGVLSFSLRSPLTEPPFVIDVGYWHFSDVPGRPDDVCFSNRPFGVKHFQTFHHRHSVDVARGLVLLFGIGTRALVWGFLCQGVRQLSFVGFLGSISKPVSWSRPAHR